MKHVERLTEINKLRNVASCPLYSENTLAMHGPMNVKRKTGSFRIPWEVGLYKIQFCRQISILDASW